MIHHSLCGRLAQLEWPTVVLLLAIHAAAAWWMRAPGITTGNDDALYLMLAEQLAQGRYHDWFIPGEPPHGQYPPGFPALLALGMAIAGDSLDFLLAINIACSVTALAVFHRLARHRLSAGTALATLATAAMNPGLIAQAGAIASEPSFMLAIAVSLALLDRSTNTAVGGVWAALAAGATTLFRAAGAPLFLAQAVHWLVQRQPRRALVAIVAGGLPVLGWFAWARYASHHTLSMTYWSGANDVGSSPVSRGLSDVAERLWGNAASYLTQELPATLMLPTTSATVLDNVAWLVVTLISLGIGGAILWRRWPAALWYLLAYGALLIAWTWPLSRFLLPVLPLILATMISGLTGWRQIPQLVRRSAATILLVVLGTGAAIELGQRATFAASCERVPFPKVSTCYLDRQQGFFSALQDAAQLAHPGDVLLTGKNLSAAYLTGMSSLPATHFVAFEGDDLLTELARLRVRFVVAAQLNPYDARLAARLNDICDELRLLGKYPGDTLLLEVRSGADTSACTALDQRLPESVVMGQPVPW